MPEEKIIFLRVTPALHRRLTTRANKAGLSLSAFLRLVLARADAAGLTEFVQTGAKLKRRRGA